MIRSDLNEPDPKNQDFPSDGARKPWEATGGARVLAPRILGAWLVLWRLEIQGEARNQSWEIMTTEGRFSIG